MKKNLRNVLVLGLGLITTIASAQWSADSRTRIDNTDSDNRTATQRLTVGADWGGIHVSADLSYDVMNGTTTQSVYEAYASTDLMGLATMTVGRQDLSFGSGALLSGNDWGMDRYTEDGISLSMDLSGFDINAGTLNGIDQDQNYLNIGGSFAGANINVLMMNNGDAAATGYDLNYAMGSFTLNASMNSDYEDDEMTSYGLSYDVFENLTASYTMMNYDGAFDMSNTAMSGGWDNGVLGYQAAGTDVTAMGITYDFGGIDLGYTMYTATAEDGSETESTAMMLGYNLNDNASIGLARLGETDNERTWITISIRP